MMLLVFYKPLGLSDDWQWPLLIAAMVCLFFFWRLQRRRKSQLGVDSAGACSQTELQRLWENKAKRLWLVIALFGILCVGNAFIGPYIVEHLSFYQSVISSVIAFIIAVAIVLFVWQRQRP